MSTRRSQAALSRDAARAANVARRPDPVTEPRAVRWMLTGIALLFLALFLVVPLVAVFYAGVEQGHRVLLRIARRSGCARRRSSSR